MTYSLESSIAAALQEASKAHSSAFASTNGVDAEWSRWYAEFLGPGLERLLRRPLDLRVLADDLQALDSAYRKEKPADPWPDYYARWLARKT
jgi:hypothetical protein